MSCGCITVNNAENKERREVETLARQYAQSNGVWVAFFQQPCGSWDFCTEKEFDSNGKSSIQYFTPLQRGNG